MTRGRVLRRGASLQGSKRASRSRWRVGSLISMLLVGLLSPATALGQSPETLLRAARHAEERADPKGAAELYGQLVELAPESRLARVAGRRLTWLRARAGDDDYATLTAVERMRRRSGDLNLAAVRELETTLHASPAGLARREGFVLAGESYLALGEGAGADRAFSRLVREPDLSPEQRHHAISGRARALMLEGSASTALDLLQREGLAATGLGLQVAQARRTQIGKRLCVAWLILFVLFAVVIGRRRLFMAETWRRALSKGRLLAGLYVVLAPILIATLFDRAAFDTFSWLALGSALVLGLTSAASVCTASRHRRLRWLLATGAVISELSVAYLVLAELGEVLSFGA